ncbi:MAG TPA: hypothetical protein VGE67_10510 [Haloferula sp.]
MSENPYQAPAVQDVVAPAAPATEVEAIRSKHLKHEASLKAVGVLCFLGGAISIVSMVAMVAVLGDVRTRSESEADSRQWVMMAVGTGVAICVAQFAAGWGLRKLRPWAKIPAGLLAVVGLVRQFPVVAPVHVIGMLVSVYVLYLLFSAKGRKILSPGYSEIVAQTPHLRYRTPLWIKIAVVVILLFLLALAVFSPGRGG